MNAVTIEWITKAEKDYDTSNRELQVQLNPNYDAVCYHAQQSAEKYLKAYLHGYSANTPKTHELIDLLELCLKLDVTFEAYRLILRQLNLYSVLYRYPGFWASETDAQSVFQKLVTFRAFIRAKLGLPPN